MRESRAQIVMLIRAFEEADQERRILPSHARVEATRRALMVTGLGLAQARLRDAEMFRNGEVMIRRARLLFEPLARRVPALFRLMRLAQLGSGTMPTLVLTALLAGAAAATVPPRLGLSVLPVAVLATLGWNALAYALMAWRRTRGPVRDRGPAARIGGLRIPRSGLLPRSLVALFLRGAIWRRRHVRRVTHASDPEAARIIDKAIIRFGALWHRLAAPLLETRVRATLHLGAITFAAGVVGGEALAVGPLHQGALLPAWLRVGPLADVGRPLVERLAALAEAPLPAPGETVAAEPWLLVHAVLLGAVVLAPRSILALVETRRASRLTGELTLDIDEPYFRRMITAWHGTTDDVVIVAYDTVLRPRAAAALKSLLHDYLGAHAAVRIEPVLRRGVERDDLEQVAPLPGRSNLLVTVFDPASEPDAEIDGDVLDRLKSVVESRGARLILVLDRSAGRRGEHRDGDATEAWREVVASRGLTAVELDLEHFRSDESTLRAVGDGVWPRRPAA